MPQTDEETREYWGHYDANRNSDLEAEQHLRNEGYAICRGVIFCGRHVNLPHKDFMAMKYLVQEWDWDTRDLGDEYVKWLTENAA